MGRALDEMFLQGPIPFRWLRRAAVLPGKGLQVALWVWHWSKVTKSDEVVVSVRKLKQGFGVGARAAARGLRALEREGLISVETHPGRSPRVRALWGQLDDKKPT